VTLLDIDGSMIEHARAPSPSASSRARFQAGSFFDALPECDVIVASLSVHHVHELDRKTSLYAHLRASLRPGGLLLCLDAAVSDDARLRARTFDAWAARMGDHGIGEAEARQHFADWAKEDRYFPLYQELSALRRAGFAEPECFWRRGQLAVFGALGA
jgi:tRNA (cmo5U34)-methyltransferase